MSNYKPITSTYVFDMYKGKVLDVIQDSLREGVVLSQKELEEQFVMMKKYIKSQLKPRILTELQQGNLKLIFAENVMKMSSVPFVMSKNGVDIASNVFVSSYGNRRADGQVSIDYRKLYTLMESAYMARLFISKYDKYKNNTVLLTQGAICYANMFVKPINKKFNLHLDKNRENSVLFLAAKFFLRNVMGVTNEEIIFNISMKACKAGNPILLKEADIQIDDEAFTNLGTFLEALKNDTLGLGLQGLTARGYLESFIGMYGGACVFALEMFPYFLFVINATTNSMGLVNNYSLEDIVEKHAGKILNQFY